MIYCGFFFFPPTLTDVIKLHALNLENFISNIVLTLEEVCFSVLIPFFWLWLRHLLPPDTSLFSTTDFQDQVWASASVSRTSPVFPSDHLFQHRPSRWLLDIFSGPSFSGPGPSLFSNPPSTHYFYLSILSAYLQHRRQRIRLATSASLLLIVKFLFHCCSFCFSCHCQQVALEGILGL